MPLNKQHGNMYGFVTHTFNIIKGKCPHNCKYCYMISIWERTNSTEQVFDEKELKTNLGEGNFIFVGSSTDIFAKEVPDEWIHKILEYCRIFNNKYLFQTKNPERFQEFMDRFPKNSILGITLETNRDEQVSQAPSPYIRKQFMSQTIIKHKTMVSIEPIIDFDLTIMLKWIKEIKPEFVSIGADSKGHGLPEPSWKKVQKLIKGLEDFTQVKAKDNLKRLNKWKTL